MKALVFGDSLSAGTNNGGISYVNYLSCSRVNRGVSGTTIGEYSPYPVDGLSLVSLIGKNISLVREADLILLEYGLNDMTALGLGLVDEVKIKLEFAKALDSLKQLNPYARIIFISFAESKSVWEAMAKRQKRYLMMDYLGPSFKELDRFDPSAVSSAICRVMKYIASRVSVVSVFTKELEDKLSEWIDPTDGLHPDGEGYAWMGSRIDSLLKEML